MIAKLLYPEIQQLIAERDLETLGDVLADWLPVDIASLGNDLSDTELRAVFQAIRGEQAAAAFEYLERTTQLRLLENLPDIEAAPILNMMAPDDRTSLLEALPEEMADELMALLSREQRAVAESLLDYPEESIGRLMTPEALVVRPDWTVRRVLGYIRATGSASETLDVIFVVDDARRLIDEIRIREILLSPLDTPVHEIMDNHFVALTVHDDQESAISVFRRYDRTVLPVVDADGTLMGVVTVDDVLDVAEQEATEDIQKFGGVQVLDEPYAAMPLLSMVRKRAPWLVVLFFGEMLTASAMGFFEHEIARAVVLTLFIPLIISSGGNTGSQAATLIIRALALGEVTLKDWWRVMQREIVAGMLLGFLLGLLGFLRIGVWGALSGEYGAHPVLLGLTVGLSLMGIVLWGTISGSMLPFLLKRFGLDPATSSAPFVATLVDVTGLVIYFTMAILLLKGTLL